MPVVTQLPGLTNLKRVQMHTKHHCISSSGFKGIICPKLPKEALNRSNINKKENGKTRKEANKKNKEGNMRKEVAVLTSKKIVHVA